MLIQYYIHHEIRCVSQLVVTATAVHSGQYIQANTNCYIVKTFVFT